ncbi:MAG: flagellar assembly protein FliH [Spirochaetes bacterium]|nr:flagellar assembly protein FliH [Spirochaetota bacterium]
MAKKVFHARDVFDLKTKVFVPPPQIERPKLEIEDEFVGPTPEEIEQENRKKLEEAEQEAMQIVEDAKGEAEKIIKEAEDGSFDYIKKASENAKKVDEEVKIKIDKYKIEQEAVFSKQIEEKKNALKKEYENTKKTAHEEGYNAGYASGEGEVQRLIDRLHVLVEGAIDKRDSIIEDAEIQVIRIILLIARKVVKAISEEQRGVVIDNIRSALEKIKGKAEVTVRVNTEDLELTTEHKEELMQRFEELRHLTILEDTRVDKGGCIIETDFGSVDARIATQLQEIEDQIRELANLSYFEGTKTVKKKEPSASESKETEVQQEEQAVAGESV